MKHDPKTRALALRLLRRPGLLLADISAQTGVHRRTLRIWADAAGLPHRSRARPSIYADATKGLAVRLYREGLTMSEIGARTGASAHAIRCWARAAGVDLRRTHTRARLDPDEARRLWVQHGYAGAARLLGCTPNAIRHHVG